MNNYEYLYTKINKNGLFWGQTPKLSKIDPKIVTNLLAFLIIAKDIGAKPLRWAIPTGCNKPPRTPELNDLWLKAAMKMTKIVISIL